MSSMLRRHDARMENLQTASTVVDASARIYSFRVDAVHFDVLKMAGGLSKAAQVIFSQEMLQIWYNFCMNMASQSYIIQIYNAIMNP